MSLTTLIWLFPAAFLLHDLEELILFEPWLKKNGRDIQERIAGHLPAWVEKQIRTILVKSTAQFALPIGLIFLLTLLSSWLAAVYGSYACFLLASSLFFLHGFMHLGQALLLRRYVPAVISSVAIVLPYGAYLFWRLLTEGLVTLPGLLLWSLAAVLLTVPFILGMHYLGGALDAGLRRLGR